MSVLTKRIFYYLGIPLFFAGIITSFAQAPLNRGYQVKAVFLFNFTQFVDWPPRAFPEANSPLIIGILGNDPFGPYLDATVANENIKGHPLVVRRSHEVEDLEQCQILYISPSFKNIEKLISKLNGRSILTVSDAPNFIQQGGMIKFLTVDNKIHLQINPKKAEAAGISISSKLLSLAEIVVK
jgi:hypothetical protein